MKFSDLKQKSKKRKVIVLTEKQLQSLTSSVIDLIEQQEIIKTSSINKKSDGK